MISAKKVLKCQSAEMLLNNIPKISIKDKNKAWKRSTYIVLYLKLIWCVGTRDLTLRNVVLRDERQNKLDVRTTKALNVMKEESRVCHQEIGQMLPENHRGDWKRRRGG